MGKELEGECRPTGGSGGTERGDHSPAALDIAQGLVARDFEERSSCQSTPRSTHLCMKPLSEQGRRDLGPLSTSGSGRGGQPSLRQSYQFSLLSDLHPSGCLGLGERGGQE